MNAAYECGVKRFINTSSYETIYSDPDNTILFTDSCLADSSGKDSFTYGKIEAEKYLQTFRETHKGKDKNMEIVTIIPTHVVGPYFSNYYNYLAWMLKEYMSGSHKFLPVYRIGICTVGDMC